MDRGRHSIYHSYPASGLWHSLYTGTILLYTRLTFVQYLQYFGFYPFPLGLCCQASQVLKWISHVIVIDLHGWLNVCLSSLYMNNLVMFCQVIGSSVLSVTQVPVSAVQGYLLWKHIFILIVFHIVQYTMISKNTRLHKHWDWLRPTLISYFYHRLSQIKIYFLKPGDQTKDPTNKRYIEILYSKDSVHITLTYINT